MREGGFIALNQWHKSFPAIRWIKADVQHPD